MPIGAFFYLGTQQLYPAAAGSCLIFQHSDDPDEVYIPYISSSLAEESCARVLRDFLHKPGQTSHF